jgi:hypothetical protein
MASAEVQIDYRLRYAQLIASFPWTPAQRAAYSHLYSIHRDVRVGLWNYVRLASVD